LLLLQCNIPEHVGLVRSTPLQTKIQQMLNGIPFISPEGLVFILISLSLSFPLQKFDAVGARHMEIENHRAN